MGTTPPILSGGAGASSPPLGCLLLVGPELWHAQCMSGPGSRILCLHPCTLCPHLRLAITLVQLDVVRINGAPARGSFN